MKGLLAVCLLLSIQPAPGKKEVEYVPLSTVQFFDFRKDSFTEGVVFCCEISKKIEIPI